MQGKGKITGSLGHAILAAAWLWMTQLQKPPYEWRYQINEYPSDQPSHQEIICKIQIGIITSGRWVQGGQNAAGWKGEKQKQRKIMIHKDVNKDR